MKISISIFSLIATFYLSSLAIAKSENGLTASGYLTVTEFGGRGLPVPQYSSTNYFQISVSSDGQYAIKVRPIHEDGDAFYLRACLINEFRAFPAVRA